MYIGMNVEEEKNSRVVVTSQLKKNFLIMVIQNHLKRKIARKLKFVLVIVNVCLYISANFY